MICMVRFAQFEGLAREFALNTGQKLLYFNLVVNRRNNALQFKKMLEGSESNVGKADMEAQKRGVKRGRER
jgi:hypothetical protein